MKFDARTPQPEPYPAGLPVQFGGYLPRKRRNMLKLVDTTALDRGQLVDCSSPATSSTTKLQLLLPRLGAGTRIVAASGDLRPADRGEHRTGVGHAPQLPAPPGDRRPRLPAGRGDFRTAVQHPATPFARICRGVVHARPRGGPDGRHAHGAGVVRTLGDDRHPAGDPRQRRTEKPRQHAARRRQHPARHALHADRDGRRTVLQFAAPPVAGRTGAARHRRGLPGPAAADGRHVQHLRRVDRLLHAAGPRGRDLRPAPEPQAQPCTARIAAGQQPAQHLEQRPPGTSTSDWQD